MKVSRRASSTLLALVALLAVASCGDDNASGGGSGKKVALIVGTESDAFYKAMECGAKTEARKLGVVIDLQGPKAFDASLQTPIVNSIAARRPDAILIAPTDSKALYPPLRQAHDAGSKIVTVDTQLENEDIVEASVRSDFVEAGVRGAQELDKLLHGKGKILLISSPPGVTTSDLSRKGFTEELKKHPGLQLVATQFSNGEPGKSASITSATLARHPDLAGIFTFNGGDAEGVVTALREAGKTKSVAFISGDAQPFQVQELRKGEVKALIVHKPYEIGAEGVRQALAALGGKPVRKVTQTSLVMATRENLDDPEVAKYLYKPC
jgi:ribose transport system substrate-binding protein